MATIFKSTGHSQFDKLLEKATSNLLLEPEWASIIQICDLIRQKDCQPKYAVGSIKRKIQAPNPHVALYGLQVLESVVKNCGSPIHEEIATKQFMEELRDLSKNSQHDNIREKVLELIQTWAHAFRKIPSYRAVNDVLNIMKQEGAKFPPLIESDVMFVADQAPEWADGECCHRCRVEFSFTQRKHHCRACGQIFCSKCSSKETTLPRFGIEKDVRVCDNCFEKHSKDTHPEDVATTPVKIPKPPNQQPDKTKELELAEEEQFQLALAISQSEAEAKEAEKSRYKPTFVKPSEPLRESPEEDSELSRYLNRSYWETKGGGTGTGPTTPVDTPKFMPSAPLKREQVAVSAPGPESTMFVDNLKSQIEMFVNRMKSNSSRGRPIANDTSVQSLFMSITHMHSQLLGFIQEQDNNRGKYETLQDKLNQVRDARAALDDLRNEHAEAIRRQAEEQERVRAFQMAQKLALMRQKKNEYLQYQRQLAMQRMQEQERDMQMRIAAEQQKMNTWNNQQQQQYMPNQFNWNLQSHGQGIPPQGYNPTAIPGMFPGQPMQEGQHGGVPGHMQQPQQIPGGQMPPQQMPPQQMPGGQLPQQMPPQQHPQQVPGGQMPPQQIPQQVPGGQMPQIPQQVPGGQMPQQQIPGGQMPQQQIPGGQMPQQQLPQQIPGQMPQQIPGGQMPPQQMAGQMPDERVLQTAELISFD